ncbi:ROK family protein [Kaarinaea lacus]
MRIGVDLGGTKIESIALANGGETLLRHRVDTPSNDYQATLQAIADLVLLMEKETGQVGTVGVGTPGAVAPGTGVMKNANSVCLNGQHFRTDLEAILKRTIRTMNDANCFALSEAIDGSAAGADVVFGVIVGTGTGGGVVINGRPLIGPNAIAGEWGHNPLPWPEPEELPGHLCYCGKHGCIETFLSGTGISRDHEKVTGEAIRGAEIVAKAEQGDAGAEATLQRYERRMAKALASVIDLIDPDVIVLGGGMSNVKRLYDNVPKIWGEYVFSSGVDDPVRTRLVPPRHGDSSGVRGAAWLWPEAD